MTCRITPLILLVAVGCGSSPTVADPGDGGPVADGGRGTDGGPAADGGPSPPDAGPTSPWRINPGVGLGVQTSAGAAFSIEVGKTYGAVRGAIGDGIDATLFAGPLDRYYQSGGYFVFLANTDQSNDGAPTPSPTLTDPDRVRYLTAVPGFLGRSPGGSAVGDPRDRWLAEFGSPAVTLPGLDDPSETRDHYFQHGLVVASAVSGGATTSVTVSRTLRTPNETIQLRSRRVGPVQADLQGSGSSVSVVTDTWGEPDQVDDYTVFGVIPGSNYAYVGAGLLFVTQKNLGASMFRVTSIVLFDPYFGKTDFANLGVRSRKSDFDSSLSSSSCLPLVRNAFGQEWTVYRLAEGHCEIRLGVAFDAQGRARALFLNFPNI